MDDMPGMDMPTSGQNMEAEGSAIGFHRMRITDEDLLQGARVVFPGRVNAISNKIKGGEQLLGKVQVVGQDAPGIVDLTVAVGSELYFETEDLADPNTRSMESSGLR